MARKQLLLYDGKRLRFLGGLLGREEEVAPGGYYTEYQTVYNAFSTKPTAAVATAQNTMVKTLVDASLWTGKFDLFYVFANDASDNALINWITPGTYDCTKVSDPSFMAYEGYQGDGSSGLNTNWNPATDSLHLSLDSVTMSAYIRLDRAGTEYAAGVRLTSSYLHLIPRSAGDLILSRINNADDGQAAATDSLGLTTVVRESSSRLQFYKNDASLATVSKASVAIPNDHLYILSRSGNIGYSNNQISFFCIGSALNNTDVSILYHSIQTYMISNSKQV